MKRILICGSRDFTDFQWIEGELKHALLADGVEEVISGGAAGADTLAHIAARKLKIPASEYVADWDRHGKAAGPLRNQRMLLEGLPDEVWAFISHPLKQSPGTLDMIRRSLFEGVPVRLYDASGVKGSFWEFLDLQHLSTYLAE